MLKPFYCKKPIGSVHTLAETLGIEKHELINLANNAENKYHTFFQAKKNGIDFRELNSPHSDLKSIQKRINSRIFKHLKFPEYLTGGIPERDYILNARMHSNAQSLIALDIENFYPNIKIKKVEEIYTKLFKFPAEVSQVLTRLTTKSNGIPQGAPTSSYLANLALFQNEYKAVSRLQGRNIRYTRLIDDITISSTRKLSKEDTTEIIKNIQAILKKDNFSLKKEKTRIVSKNNPEDLMEVTGLWINRGEPRIKAGEKKQLDKEIHKIKNEQIDSTQQAYHQRFYRLSGQLARITVLNYPKAKRYYSILNKNLPTYCDSEEAKTKKLLKAIIHSTESERKSESYKRKFFKILHRANIISRTNKKLARDIKSQLKRKKPLGIKSFYGEITY